MKKITSLLFLFFVLTILNVNAGVPVSPEDTPKPAVKAKNIIFLIGDGMGLNQIFGAYTVNGGSLAIERVSHVGLQKTQSADSYITDSAASGTALACGKKTNNGMIGMDPDKKDLESILKFLDKLGFATGLVSTSAITHATPASFIANEESRNSYEAIAADFLETDIDLFIGGGLDHFSKRKDKRDLTEELRNNGYTVTTSIDELASVQSGKLAAFTADVHNKRVSEGRNDMLPVATQKALALLSQDADGFFVMIEGSEIDWGGHANNQEYVITETLDFDRACKIALDFAENDGETLVVITADHETGGMIILDGDIENKQLKSKFTTLGHTGQFIPVFAYGPGAELFTGIFDNTEFKEKFVQALGLETSR